MRPLGGTCAQARSFGTRARGASLLICLVVTAFVALLWVFTLGGFTTTFPSSFLLASEPVEKKPTQGVPQTAPRLRKDPDRTELECGDLGTHQQLRDQRSVNGEKLERDHVPSNGALRKRTDFLLFGRPLTPEDEARLGAPYQRLKRAIHRHGYSIAIPAGAHRGLSQTHGQGFPRMIRDAAGLAQAARRDMAALRAGLLRNDPRTGRPYATTECLRAYQAASRELMKLTDADYDARLLQIVARLPAQDREEMARNFAGLDEE